MKYVIPLLIVLLGLGCGEEKSKSNDAPASQTTKKPNEAVSESEQELSTKASKPLYYFSREGRIFIYERNSGTGLGIIDSSRILLPHDYDKIYNPDMLSEGIIEIEQNGKLGLFNYRTKEIIPCEYDLFFPPTMNSAIALGKKGKAYYHIFSGGKTTQLGDSEPIPSYDQLEFDAFAVSDNWLRSAYRYNSDTYDPLEEGGILITPSYINVPNLMSDRLENLVLSTDEEFEVEKHAAKLVIEGGPQSNSSILAFFSSFIEEGVEGREYQLEKHSIITGNGQKLNLDKLTLPEIYNNERFYYCSNWSEKPEWINDSTFSVKLIVIHHSDSIPVYRNMMVRNLYEVSKEGKMTQLDAPRFFDETKFVKMDDSWFMGCYFEKNKESKDYSTSLLQTNHLNIEALDIMRNEIFAEYGYRFKSKKWQEYFGKKDWYKPRFDNVDDMLSPIEKHNIDLILKTKARIEADPSILNTRETFFPAAG